MTQTALKTSTPEDIDLGVRKHPLAECERCPLLKRGKYVATQFPNLDDAGFPTGDGNGLAFIGESPGKQEKLRGKPFIGPSGRLLDTVLDTHGIKRDESVLTNAALCNYRDEDKDSLPGAIDACRPRLLAELDEAGVHTAVTLGNAAKRSLLDTKQGITKVRGGEAKDADYGSPRKVVPTFHPAAALRNQAQFPLLLSDVSKVKPKVGTWRAPEVTVIEDVQRALAFLKTTKTKTPLVVDVETGTEKEESYNRTTNLLCVGLGSTHPKHGDRVIVIGRPAIHDVHVQDALIDLVLRTGVICQNGKFDVYILSLINRSAFPIELMYDTMLASYSLNENPGTHGLKYMGQEYLGAPVWEDEIKPYLHAHKDPPEVVEAARNYLLQVVPRVSEQLDIMKADIEKESPVSKTALGRAAKEMQVIEYKGEEGEKYATRIRWALPDELPLLSPSDADGSYASIPPPLLHKYNAFDVQVTRMLYDYFRDRQERAGLTELNTHLMTMSNALMRVERNGLRLDYEVNSRLYDEFTEYLKELDVFSFNPGSWQQLRKHMLETWGIKMSSTDEDHLIELRNKTRDESIRTFVSQLLEFRRWGKLRSTYVTSIRQLAIDNNGVVLPTFKIDQATTGRLASKNPNVQNIPRKFDIKAQFVPSTADRIFVYADYSQLELRVLTWLAQDEGMREIFNDPTRDLFDELTPAVYGMTKEAFAELKANDPVAANEMRVVVKSFAYGVSYGRTAYGIAADPKLQEKVQLTVAEAEVKLQAFQAQIPAIMAFQRKTIRSIHKGKDLVNVFGRRRRFHLLTDQNRGDLEKQAMAYLPQSTASDICVTALSRLPRWMDPRNVIHDAILCEAPRDEMEEHKRILRRTMIETAEEITGGYVSFDAKPEHGERWSDIK